MLTHRGLVLVILLGSLFAGAALNAATLEGYVKGPDGKPVRDAEVEIARSNTRTALQKVKTNQRGHYEFKRLTEGNSYKLTVWVNKAPASVENVQTTEEIPVRIDLNLLPATSKKRLKIQAWVYIPEDTGSHLGRQWVAMDENGNVGPGVNPVARWSGKDLKEAYSHIDY